MNTEQSNKISIYLPAFVILFLTLVRLYLSMSIGLHPDEAYYWEWSRKLDLSYYDQGPGVALFIAFFTRFLGDTHIALKSATATAAAITLGFSYASARLYGLNRIHSMGVLLILSFAPSLFLGSMLIMHDSPLILFWSAALYFSLRYLKLGNKNVDLFMMFISLAGGFLSKHTMVFFALSLILWILIDPARLKIIKNKMFYAGFGLALLISTPVLYWNLQHNWAGVEAIVYLRSSGGVSDKSGGVANLIIGQMLSVTPFWFLIPVFLGLDGLYSYLKRNFKIVFSLKQYLVQALRNYFGRIQQSAQIDKDVKHLVFLNGMILPIFFLAISFDRIIQANWLYPSYPALVISTAGVMQNSMKWKRLSRALLGLGGLVSAGFIFLGLFSLQVLPVLPDGFPVKTLPGLQTEGYEEIVNKVVKLRSELDPEAGIAANRYQDAAIASWYLRGHEDVDSINILQKNQYSFWNIMQTGRNYFIFHVNEDQCDAPPILLEPVLKYMFGKVSMLEEGKISYNGIVHKNYMIWHAVDYRRPWDTMLLEYINKRAIFDMMPNMNMYNTEDKRAKKTGNQDVVQMMARFAMLKKESGKEQCGQ